MPTISVIVPIYKVEQYLKRCIDSILSQTFDDFDLILVDDGSPDNCGKICEEYSQKDSRIAVIHKENGGLADARNAGIDWSFANSDSVWLTFIDSDDWIHPVYLEALFYGVISNNVNISCCNIMITSTESVDFRQSEGFKADVIQAGDAFRDDIGWFYSACAKLYKKELFVDERFPKGLLHEDAALITKILFLDNRISFLDKRLYYYYVNPNSITKSKKTKKHFTDYYLAYRNQMSFFSEKNFQDEFNLVVKRCFKSLQYNLYCYNYDHELYKSLMMQKEEVFQLLAKERSIKSDHIKQYKKCLIETKDMIRNGIESDYENNKKTRGKLISFLIKKRELLKLLFFNA